LNCVTQAKRVNKNFTQLFNRKRRYNLKILPFNFAAANELSSSKQFLIHPILVFGQRSVLLGGGDDYMTDEYGDDGV